MRGLIFALLLTLSIEKQLEPPKGNENPEQPQTQSQQQKSPVCPSCLGIDCQITQISNSAQANKDEDSFTHRLYQGYMWATIAGVLGGFIGLYVIWCQFKETARTTNITYQTMVLAQRPRIAVRAFYFRDTKGTGAAHDSPPGIYAGSFCLGQFYIQNIGGTDCRIMDYWCEIYIDNKLPMKRPYEGEEASKSDLRLKPGKSTFYLFGIKLGYPLDATTADDIMKSKSKNFYVLGWIGYMDDLGIYRITGFCRVYDPFKDRFIPVDDPHYEYTD